MAGGKFSLANLFGITLRESANDGSDFTNPDADYRRVFLGEDGALHAKDSAGTVTGLSSGSSLTVEDEGTPLATAATTLDFVGAGVTATGAGAEKTITIPGGGGDLVLINSVVLGSPATNMEVSSIPGTYIDLVISVVCKTDEAGADTDHMLMRLGGGALDTGANYRAFYGYHGTGTGVVGGNTAVSTMDLAICAGSGSSQAAAVFSIVTLEILNYANTAQYRMIKGSAMYFGVSYYEIYSTAGQWRNAADAVQIVRVYPSTGTNFVTGSRMDVYGRG
jgi:hypothetical protein